MLDQYILDYIQKNNYVQAAKAFQMEAKVKTNAVAIDVPGGFLSEWWAIFWDVFIARTNSKHSDAATSYVGAQNAKQKQQLLSLVQQLSQPQRQGDPQLTVHAHPQFCYSHHALGLSLSF
jgi:hypothetical protein